MKKLSIALAALALSAAIAPLAAAEAQNIAIVNNKPVPKARLDLVLTQIAKQGQTPNEEQQKQLRDRIVMREILTQEAERLSLQGSAEYKAQMEFQRQNLLIDQLFTEFRKKHPVTDAELQAEYDKLKATKSQKEYHARHILVEKEDEAKALIAQLKGGADFGELAKKSSKDPGSAKNGGDLDWAAPSSYVPEFSQAMVQLDKGKFTETPVKSQFGYHVILLEDTRDQQFPPLAEIRQQLEQNMMQQKQIKYSDDLRAKAKTDYKFSNN